MRKIFWILFVLVTVTRAAFAAEYVIDADHTAISFKVKHLLSNVQGQFKEFEGKFTYDPEKPETWKVEAVIYAGSIDTNNAERDKHLRSKDFFDVENIATITFKSTSVTDVTSTNAKLHGLLTIHGVEKPVVLALEVLGVEKDPWGNVAAGFTATTKINRKDFGLTWNQVLETGGVLVGEEVTITLDVAGLLQE